MRVKLYLSENETWVEACLLSNAADENETGPTMIMNKCVAIQAALPVKHISVFDRLKASMEERVFGHVLDPEHDSNLFSLLIVLQMGSKSDIRNAVSTYLTGSISRHEDAGRVLCHRLCVFLGFLHRTLDKDSEKVDLKFVFFKEAFPHLEKCRMLTLGPPTLLGIGQGFLSRGREFDAKSGKSRVRVDLHQGTLVLTNMLLGRGVFGSVKTGVLDRGKGSVETVAVKRIRLGTSWQVSYPAFLEALNEVLIPARLGPHPNIMPVYDFYVYDDGKKKKNADSKEREIGACPKFGIVMPKAFCTGDAIVSKRLKDGVDVLYKAALGLSHMEMMTYMHNDFKPANIFLFEDGSVKLGDFGCSYPRGEEPRDNTLGGTFPSPEAVEMKIPKYEGVDFTKIDTFSFGVVLYELLYYKTHLDWALKSMPGPPLYIADFENGYLCEQEVFDNALQKTVLKPKNPVVTFLEMAREYCETLKERSKLAKNRFVPCLADLALDCLVSDPRNRPSMRDVVRRLTSIQGLLAPLNGLKES